MCCAIYSYYHCINIYCYLLLLLLLDIFFFYKIFIPKFNSHFFGVYLYATRIFLFSTSSGCSSLYCLYYYFYTSTYVEPQPLSHTKQKKRKNIQHVARVTSRGVPRHYVLPLSLVPRHATAFPLPISTQ